MHIIGNMIYLWAFGRAMEDAMGSVRFLFFYLAGGVVAMFAQILGDPTSHIPCLGASGAIAAVMGAFIITFPRDRIHTFIFFVIFFRITFIPAVLLIGFWFLMQLSTSDSRRSPHRRRRVPRPHRRIPLRRDHRKAVREPPQDDLQPLQLNHSRKP